VIKDRPLAAARGCRASGRSAPSRIGWPSLHRPRLFSANLSSSPPSPREIGSHQTTVTFTHGAVDFTEGLRSSAQPKESAAPLGSTWWRMRASICRESRPLECLQSGSCLSALSVDGSAGGGGIGGQNSAAVLLLNFLFQSLFLNLCQCAFLDCGLPARLSDRN
jgi:hypothetical protein